MTDGWQPERCTCGHTIADHASGRTSWPHPPQYGICLSQGCACKVFVLRPADDRDGHDAIQDARAELAGEGVFMSTREAVSASLGATHGNGDLYPHLRDSVRHPFGLPSPNVPTEGHLAPAIPSAGAPMTPDGLRTLSPGAQADGSPDLPDLAA